MRKAYSKYKPSDVEWIGDIPEHWSVLRLRHLIKGRLMYGANESAELDDANLPRYIRITDFGDDGKLRDDTFRSLPVESAKDYYLTDGDILFARSGATVGKTFQYKGSSSSACFAGYLIRATPNTKFISSDFLYYFTKSVGYENWKNSIFSQATIQNIGADKYQNLIIPVPASISEQNDLVNLLHRETEKIDSLIAKKNEFIERLKEKRTALISQVVTKGLPPEEAKKHGLPVNPKMKPSGVDWLGEIPEHWDLSKLKYLFRFKSGGTPNTENDAHWNGQVPWVSPKDMKTFFISETQDNITPEAVAASAASLVPQGTLLMVVRSGILRHTIPVAITTSEMAINQDIKAFIPIRGDTDSRYWAFLIEGKEALLLDLWKKSGTTVESIETGLALGTIVPSPKLNEQKAIGEYLSKVCGDMDDLLAKIKHGVATLQEYRSALITSVVTGKIDVREAAT